MDRLESLTIFSAVAENGSFIAASRALGKSTTAVSRAIGDLEAELGVQLLRRTTRAVSLTEAGQQALRHAQRVLSEYGDLRNVAADARQTIGNITVTAPNVFGQMHILPIISDFMKENMGIHVTLLLSNRLTNLVDEGIDVGFRIAQLQDSGLRALGLGTVREICCASPRYLVEAGIPQSPEDIKDHRVIAVTDARPLPLRWRFSQNGKSLSLIVKPNLIVNSVPAALDAAALGIGIARALSYQISPHERTRSLTRILREYEPPSLPIHVVYPSSRHLPSKTRAFIDFAVAALRGHF